MNGMHGQDWLQRMFGLLVLLLAMAWIARLIHALLAPLAPILLAFAVVLAIGWFIVRWR
jgi:hypothetical protein